MTEYEVTLLIDASINMTVQADSPEDAAYLAEEKADFRSLCYQCAKDLDTGDVYGAYVYLDDKKVADTTRAGHLEAEVKRLQEELAQLKAAQAPLDGIEWKAQGDANDYVLLRGNHWIARIFMNGELTIPAQEAMLRAMLERRG